MSASRTLLAALAIVPTLVLLAPVALVVLVLHGVAVLTRAIGRALEPQFVPWSELMAFDSRLGWTPRPRLQVHYLAEGDDVFHVETDAEGWPGRRGIDESDVVAIGDSFAFGYGIDTSHSFAELPRKWRVKAVGAPGYSMVHGVLLMEQLGKRLENKLVVWLIYLENDLQDNLAPEMRQYRAPFVRHDRHGWRIEVGHLSAAPWRCSDLDRRRLFARFCVPGPLADRAYSAADFLIGRARAACRAAGAQLVIVTVPHVVQLTPVGQRELAKASGDPQRCDAGMPDRELARICRQHDVEIVAGRDHLNAGDYKRREGIHWNAGGHRRMAEMIAALADARLTTAGPQGHRSESMDTRQHTDERPAVMTARARSSTT